MALSSGPINDVEEVFILCEKPEDALQIAMDTQAASNRSGDKKQRALGLIKAADAHAQIGRTQDATAEVAEANTLCKDLKLDEATAALMNVQTRINLNEGEFDKAMGSANDVLKRFRNLGYRKGEGVALVTLAEVAIAKEEAADAIKFAKEGLGIFQELGEKKGEAAGYMTLSNAFLATGDTGKGAKMVWKAVTIFRELGNKTQEGAALNTIAGIELEGNDLAKAEKAARAAEELCKESNNVEGQAIAMGVLVDVHFARGENEDGIELAKTRTNLLFDAGLTKMQVEAMIHMTQIEIAAGNFDRANGCAEMALQGAQGLRERDLMEAAMEAVNNAKRERVSADIQASLDANEDMLHIPATLTIKPLWNKSLQNDFSELANGM